MLESVRRQLVRRQLLADMGIEVWRLRTATPATKDQAIPSGAPPVPAPARKVAAEASRQNEPAAPAENPPATPAEGLPAPDADDCEPWSAVSVAVDGVVMLLHGAPSRRDARLVRDVLSAASGDWRSKPVRRRFDWPPKLGNAGVAGAASAGGGRRAFSAFVDKDVADHAARLLLAVASLADLLPETVGGCRKLLIPDLEILGRDAEAKRALWQRLRGAGG